MSKLRNIGEKEDADRGSVQFERCDRRRAACCRWCRKPDAFESRSHV